MTASSPDSFDLPDWARAVADDPRFVHLGKPSNTGMNWVHAAPADRRLWVEYYADHERKKMVGVAMFDDRAVGHAGCAHGGAIASLIDDILGTTAWLAAGQVYSVNLNVDFRQRVPLRTFVRLEAEVRRVEGRKVHAACRMISPPDRLHAEAVGIFVAPRTADPSNR